MLSMLDCDHLERGEERVWRVMGSLLLAVYLSSVSESLRLSEACNVCRGQNSSRAILVGCGDRGVCGEIRR